jgi:hypothetical protein
MSGVNFSGVMRASNFAAGVCRFGNWGLRASLDLFFRADRTSSSTLLFARICVYTTKSDILLYCSTLQHLRDNNVGNHLRRL